MRTAADSARQPTANAPADRDRRDESIRSSATNAKSSAKLSVSSVKEAPKK